MANKKKPLKKQKIRNSEYYDMQSVFDELYADSVKGKQFQNLVELIRCPENIMLAYRNIRKNDGSKTAGVDNKTISDLNRWKDKTLVAHVQRKLDWYVPNAVRRVEIPKDNGKTRPLGIPTIMDRLIQQCILQVLEPICEAKFFKRSNGFRPNQSAENAIAQAERMWNVGGISQTEAQKSSDLYMKCRYLDELTGGRGVVFATGTPISNSMVEMYTMQKYLQYGALSRDGLLNFDAWASTFGETVTAIELAPEGTGYRSKTRFARFYNLPELIHVQADRRYSDLRHAETPGPQGQLPTCGAEALGDPEGDGEEPRGTG